MSVTHHSTENPTPHTSGETAALFSGRTAKEVEYPVAPESDPIGGEFPDTALARHQREWQRDRVIAMSAVGALLLLGLVMMLRFNRTVGQHAARAQVIDVRLTKIESDNGKLADQLRRSRAELATTNQQLDAAQMAIDALERGPRSPGGSSSKRLAAITPRGSMTRTR